MEFPDSNNLIFRGITKGHSCHGTKAMHGVNLDLLRTGPHHLDGRPKDPHAHHRAELLALSRAARRQAWHNRFARLRLLLVHRAPRSPASCRADHTV
jgi:hypothetical protein